MTGPGWTAARKECIRLAGGRCKECGVDPSKVGRIRDLLRTIQDPLQRFWRPGPRLMSYGVELSRWFEDQIGWRSPTSGFGQVDHIWPRAEGGTNKQTNLRYLCQWCHSKYTRAFAKKRGRAHKTKIGEQKYPHARLKMGQRRPGRW